jgi:hypothetical protein
MEKPTREEFMNALEEQGYIHRENYAPKGKFADEFARSAGPYLLDVVVWKETTMNYMWGLTVNIQLQTPKPWPQQGQVISAGGAKGDSYNIAEFNEALNQISKNIKEARVPSLIEKLQSLKELADLLKDEK